MIYGKMRGTIRVDGKSHPSKNLVQTVASGKFPTGSGVYVENARHPIGYVQGRRIAWAEDNKEYAFGLSEEVVEFLHDLERGSVKLPNGDIYPNGEPHGSTVDAIELKLCTMVAERFGGSVAVKDSGAGRRNYYLAMVGARDCLLVDAFSAHSQSIFDRENSHDMEKFRKKYPEFPSDEWQITTLPPASMSVFHAINPVEGESAKNFDPAAFVQVGTVPGHNLYSAGVSSQVAGAQRATQMGDVLELAGMYYAVDETHIRPIKTLFVAEVKTKLAAIDGKARKAIESIEASRDAEKECLLRQLFPSPESTEDEMDDS